MEYHISIRDTVAQPMISIRGRVPLSGMQAFVARAFRAEFALLGSTGVRPAGPPFAIYHDPEFREDDIDVEVGVPVAEPVAASGDVLAGELPGGPVATTLHVGPYDDMAGAYHALATWITEHGHEMAGPPREIYLNGPTQVRDASEYRTEVVWPIRP